MVKRNTKSGGARRGSKDRKKKKGSAVNIKPWETDGEGRSGGGKSKGKRRSKNSAGKTRKKSSSGGARPASRDASAGSASKGAGRKSSGGKQPAKSGSRGPRRGERSNFVGIDAGEAIFECVRKHPGVSAKQVLEHLEKTAGSKAGASASGVELATIEASLAELQRDGWIVCDPARGWDLPERSSYRAGFLHMDRRGRGFVELRAPDEDDIYLGSSELDGAFKGDHVLVRLVRGASRDRLREGELVEVIERSRKLIRGTYHAAGDVGGPAPSRRRRKGSDAGGYLECDDREAPVPIAIPEVEKGSIRTGDRALVRLLPGRQGVHPLGEIALVLRDEGSLESDREVVILEFGLPAEHPPEVLAAAEALPDMRDGDAWPERVDLRELDTITIDPVDARDFDDAVSLEPTKSGGQRLGVHIADVSHYVRPGDVIDREAEERSTSIYLPGHVIPMLPERLANGLCSLRPDEDRLAKSVFLTFSPTGRLTTVRVQKTVIRSKRRFTYEEVQTILDDLAGVDPKDELPADAQRWRELIASMARLRDHLRKKRADRGALSLDIPQLRLQLDPSGEVTGIGRDEADPAHQLIEEFMLAANEAVARFLGERDLPQVGRAHPAPDEEKLGELKDLVDALGFRLEVSREGPDFRKLIAEISDSPLAQAIQLAMLRTMGHAEYIPGQASHFALATDAYCHFTSPIRRYPDLIVHQILDEQVAGKLRPGRSARKRDRWQARCEAVSPHASNRERRAESAERAMVQAGIIRFLRPHIGEEMEGWIVSVQRFGFFVRLEETLVEGLVHVSSLGDYYEFDAGRHELRAQRGRQGFRLGARVRVILSELDSASRQITFRVAADA